MRADSAMLGVSAYERNEHDHYPTPANCTRAIAAFLKSNELLTHDSIIWESAVGNDAMARVLREEFAEVIGTDLHTKIDSQMLDFLTDKPDFEYDAIITNPPYSDVDAWIARCLHYVRENHCLAAMLMRNEINCASTRKRFFDDCPEYAFRLTLTWRPRWIEGSTGSPRHNYTWFGWVAGHIGPAKEHFAFRRDYEE